MPKSQLIDPKKELAKGELILTPIPLNQYDKTLKDVKDDFKREDLINFYKDMRYIREFEMMIQGLRTVRNYNGVEYAYIGPAHLSIGQEGYAVGQAYVLDHNDFSFGTHRSHSEVLARSFSAIRKMSEKELEKVLSNFKDGMLLSKVQEFSNNKGNIRGLAVDFILYGFMCEIFGRKYGLTGGLGNSMHAFFAPFGLYPQNAIVGGSAGLATGAALFKRLNDKNGICVANIGDGSLSTGHVWEAINFASMGQFRLLWEERYKGGLPVIYNFLNNGYGMTGQTNCETMGYQVLARVGAAFNPEQLYAERVNGLNIFAVIDAFSRKKKMAQQKVGPFLIDMVTYRLCGHSAIDQNAYRTSDEVEIWAKYETLANYRGELVKLGIADKKMLDKMDDEIIDRITGVLVKASDIKFSPRMDLGSDPNAIAKLMYNNKQVKAMDSRKPEVIGNKEDNVRLKKISTKSRKAFNDDGKPVSPIMTCSYRDAIYEALIDKFYEDPTMVLFGEDVREHGNAFGVLQGLYESIPRHRLFNTPIAEASIISAAVGYALSGGRAVPEIMWCDFVGRCADELFNQLAKWQGMSSGLISLPVVVRIMIGAKYGAQHSQDWTSLFAHIPGLKIVYPATPYDAKGLLCSALESTDPVVYFESQSLLDIGEQFAPNGVPKESYYIPIGEPEIKRHGKDITIFTVGACLYQAIDASIVLMKNWGISAEVIDARSIVPFNYDPVLESVKKTGKIVIVSDACERGSLGKNFSSNITEMAFDDLDAPPVVLGSKNSVSPCLELEKFFYPQSEWIIDAIHQKIMPLDGHFPKFDFTRMEKVRKEKLGI